MLPPCGRRLSGRTTSIALLVVAACLALGAMPAAAAAGTGSRGAQTRETSQYHRSNGGQYHGGAASSTAVSAWLREARPKLAEFGNSISPLVISPIFTFSAPNSIRNRSHHAVPWIGSENDRPISSQIESRNGPDTRLWFQIGAGLGLVYTAFLGAWFWATRFRPRSAHI